MDEKSTGDTRVTRPQPPRWTEAGRRQRGRHFRVATLLLGLLVLGYLTPRHIVSKQDARPKTTDEPNDPMNPWKSITPSTELVWHPCYASHNPRFRCARLTVPMDYARPLTSAAPASSLEGDKDSSIPKVHIALLLLPGQSQELGDNTTTTTQQRTSSSDPHQSSQKILKQPLLINPGGPGGSGVLVTLLLGSSLQQILGPDQPILGFDPRGVSFTTPAADCWAVPSAWGATSDDHTRDNDEGDVAAGMLHRLEFERVAKAYGLVSEGPAWMRYLEVAQRGVVELCRRQAGARRRTQSESVLAWAGTRHVARDMLAIVDAWERWVDGVYGAAAPRDEALRGKLVYWGLSYGTYLGATFARMFPRRVGRMVLDGVVDAEGYEQAVWMRSLVDADKVLAGFFRDCAAARAKCHFYRPGDAAQDVERRYHAVMDRLRTDPVTFTHPQHFYPVVLRYGAVKLFVFGVLYQPVRGFPALATLLDYIERGQYEHAGVLFQDGKLLCSVAGNPMLSEAMSDAQRAIMCSDKAQPMNMTLPELTATYHALANTSQFADVWMTVMAKCNGWDIAAPPADPWAASARTTTQTNHPSQHQQQDQQQTQPQDHQTEDATQIATAHPLLFLANTHDPVTPLRAAVAMARRFRHAGLLEQRSQGHCSIAAASRCTARVLRAYLADGTVPPPPPPVPGVDLRAPGLQRQGEGGQGRGVGEEEGEGEDEGAWERCGADEAPWGLGGIGGGGGFDSWTAEEREVAGAWEEVRRVMGRVTRRYGWVGETKDLERAMGAMGMAVAGG